MTESHDLHQPFEDIRATIPPPIRAAEHRAALLHRAETVTVTGNADARPLDWSAPVSTNGFGRHKRMSKRTIIALAAALMLVSTALAQQIIQFFTPDEDDELQTTIYVQPPIDFEGREEEFRIPPLDELVTTLPFTPLFPTVIPDNFSLEIAYLYRESDLLIVHYGCKRSRSIGFSITQQTFDAAEIAGTIGPLNVGASAVIETVQIGSMEGQYVEGGWQFGALPTYDPNTPVIETTQTWNNDAPSSMLRWHQDGKVFLLRNARNSHSNSSCALGKDDLVAIAESLGQYNDSMLPTPFPQIDGSPVDINLTPTPVS